MAAFAKSTKKMVCSDRSASGFDAMCCAGPLHSLSVAFAAPSGGVVISPHRPLLPGLVFSSRDEVHHD